jgi:hypothetical protein
MDNGAWSNYYGGGHMFSLCSPLPTDDIVERSSGCLDWMWINSVMSKSLDGHPVGDPGN